MSWTKWHTPKKVKSIASDEIEFTDGDDVLDSTSNIASMAPVKGVSTSYGELVTLESQSLVFTDFGFDVDNDKVTGIEVELHVTRLARIQDRVVQLWKNNKAAGINKADLDAADIWSYGGSNDIWKTQRNNFNNSGFGLLLDFQPHTRYPSSNTVYLRRVRMRLHLVD
jgi:hypothetical protein